MKRFLKTISFITLLCTSSAYAHVMLESSSPKNNGVIQVAPKTLDLTFGHPTKLVVLKLQQGENPIPLKVDMAAEPAKVFSVPLPPLSPGHYQATWSTLSADGHPMKGIISFTIAEK